ncbi:WhiB family transcriptional regulator [Kribbella sp. NPDC020789]
MAALTYDLRDLSAPEVDVLKRFTGIDLATDTDRADDWQDRGLCAQTDPESFFPEKGGSTRDAKKICAGCPVAAQCLEWALENDERFGIWGGKSERERRKIAKDRKAGR